MSFTRNEAELLARIARRDTAACSDLYDRMATALFSFALKILRDVGAAEDVLQEVFIQIVEKASSYDPRLGKPLSWAIMLARNRAIDRFASWTGWDNETHSHDWQSSRMRRRFL
ncbi:MAG: hypothetical protein L0Y58_13220 [Verrucomicrobia subdivision 3 bacterium]|nr:hypothetical protein [Limisphaerales bacterium]